jgi:hypothetical protein
MIVLIENKRNTPLEAAEDTAGKVSLRDFIKPAGRKPVCQAEWTSKTGLIQAAAGSPAFCGFDKGHFYPAAAQNVLSVKLRFDQ